MARYSSDITTTSGAISSGYSQYLYPSYAFDNNSSTEWGSIGDSVRNYVVWIGQKFSVRRRIGKIRFIQYHKGDLYYTYDHAAKSVRVDYSDDGSTWTGVQSFTNLSYTDWVTLDIGGGGSHRYWRLLYTEYYRDTYSGDKIGAPWLVQEIEMFERLSSGFMFATDL